MGWNPCPVVGGTGASSQMEHYEMTSLRFVFRFYHVVSRCSRVPKFGNSWPVISSVLGPSQDPKMNTRRQRVHENRRDTVQLSTRSEPCVQTEEIQIQAFNFCEIQCVPTEPHIHSLRSAINNPTLRGTTQCLVTDPQQVTVLRCWLLPKGVDRTGSEKGTISSAAITTKVDAQSSESMPNILGWHSGSDTKSMTGCRLCVSWLTPYLSLRNPRSRKHDFSANALRAWLFSQQCDRICPRLPFARGVVWFDEQNNTRPMAEAITLNRCSRSQAIYFSVPR